MINIRKAVSKDWSQYSKLRKESDEEYSKIVGVKLDNQSTKELSDDFNDYIKSKNKIILIAESDRKLIGYLFGSHTTKGNLDFIYITKEFRKQGVGKSLIGAFIQFLKTKKQKKICLELNSKNKTAFNAYKRLGFKTYLTKIKMEKKI
jgi:ribosomal protein S18 acetylase RimI-like enzyme